MRHIRPSFLKRRDCPQKFFRASFREVPAAQPNEYSYYSVNTRYARGYPRRERYEKRSTRLPERQLSFSVVKRSFSIIISDCVVPMFSFSVPL